MLPPRDRASGWGRYRITAATCDIDWMRPRFYLSWARVPVAGFAGRQVYAPSGKWHPNALRYAHRPSRKSAKRRQGKTSRGCEGFRPWRAAARTGQSHRRIQKAAFDAAYATNRMATAPL